MSEHDELLTQLAALRERPLDFVLWAFPWGEPGTELQNRSGPEPWQRQFLYDLQLSYLESRKHRDANGKLLVSPIELPFLGAIKSGKDVGKTALLCWIVIWFSSTSEDTRGRVTANTEKQLLSVLWTELAKWHNLFIGRTMFRREKTALFSSDPNKEETWRVSAMAWSETNLEAFQGLHNYGKRLLFLFDEASGIHDGVWEAIDGSMHEADTEILWIATSNPTRALGRFRECFRGEADEWHQYSVDAREVSFTNKEVIAASIARNGLESDYVKKRFLGQFPDTASAQLIPLESIREARVRTPETLMSHPLIMGIDLARLGDNENVAVFRRGPDARTIPAQRWRDMDGVQNARYISSLIGTHRPDTVFADEGGLGGPIIDFVRSLGYPVIGVNFGSKPTVKPGGQLCGNKRAEMYVHVRDWIAHNGCIESHNDLEKQLIAIEYFFRRTDDALMLISKEDMILDDLPSPDWADALALTFAYPVSERPRFRGNNLHKFEYDPYGESAFPYGYKDPERTPAEYLH